LPLTRRHCPPNPGSTRRALKLPRDGVKRNWPTNIFVDRLDLGQKEIAKSRNRENVVIEVGCENVPRCGRDQVDCAGPLRGQRRFDQGPIFRFAESQTLASRQGSNGLRHCGAAVEQGGDLEHPRAGLDASADGLFIVYQLYRFSYTHGFGLIVLTVFDVFVIGLIWHEYRLVRRHLPLE
jgi:hypothetical protein